MTIVVDCWRCHKNPCECAHVVAETREAECLHCHADPCEAGREAEHDVSGAHVNVPSFNIDDAIEEDIMYTVIETNSSPTRETIISTASWSDACAEAAHIATATGAEWREVYEGDDLVLRVEAGDDESLIEAAVARWRSRQAAGRAPTRKEGKP